MAESLTCNEEPLIPSAPEILPAVAKLPFAFQKPTSLIFKDEPVIPTALEMMPTQDIAPVTFNVFSMKVLPTILTSPEADKHVVSAAPPAISITPLPLSLMLFVPPPLICRRFKIIYFIYLFIYINII